MKYYLIHQENELRLISVTPEQEIDFLLHYSQQILVSGETIREVLKAFHEMPLIIGNNQRVWYWHCENSTVAAKRINSALS